MTEATKREASKVWARMRMEENRERYYQMGCQERNADEEHAWDICQYIQPSPQTVDKQYEPKRDIGDAEAKRYLRTLTELLDKLGWAKLPE